jgi:hypothetical protein
MEAATRPRIGPNPTCGPCTMIHTLDENGPNSKFAFVDACKAATFVFILKNIIRKKYYYSFFKKRSC